MDLVVTTPGVPTTTVRTALESESRDRLLVIDRATRCGSTRVDPTTARRLRVAVVPCAVSLHAADRFCARFAASHTLDESRPVDGSHTLDGIVVCQRRGSSAPAERLETRFDCPVSPLTVGVDREGRGRYCER